MIYSFWGRIRGRTLYFSELYPMIHPLIFLSYHAVSSFNIIK
nr:MAG TPA: hypothetical protein [Caudoviricetes sp.]